MHRVLNFMLLLWISINKMAFASIDIQGIHDDLRKVKPCQEDNCPKGDDSSNYDCSCNANCAQFGNCCLNSSYIEIPSGEVKYTCRSVSNDKAYFMIDRCPTSDSIWENLCHSEWDGDGDLLELVPVTSTLTSITYKNYFCFKCHEVSGNFLYWNVELSDKPNDYDMPNQITIIQRSSLAYNRDTGTWFVLFGEDRIPVDVSFRIPNEKYPLIKECDSTIISGCSSEWGKSETREKCKAYMGLRQVVKQNNALVFYKNLHCALCNYENLNDISCNWGRITYAAHIPSFSAPRFILDISPSGGEKIGRYEKCDDEHELDPSNHCRKITCVLPGYKPNKKRGICVPK